VRALTAEERRLDSAGPDTALPVTIRVGGLRIRTTPLLESVSRVAAEGAMKTARTVLGAEADSVASGMMIALGEVHLTSEARKPTFLPSFLARSSGRPTGASLTIASRGRIAKGTGYSWPVSRDRFAGSILGTLAQAVAARMPAPLEPWLGHIFPVSAMDDRGWEIVYRDLATSDAGVARRCSTGNLPACRLALLLDAMPANRLTAWYDESDYPRLVKNIGNPNLLNETYRSRSGEEQEACIVGQRLDACRRMLSLFSEASFREPTIGYTRSSLVLFALETGGADALARLHSATATTTLGQLAQGAGIGEDSLLARWQRRVADARPHSPLPDFKVALASLAWAAFCGALAMRARPWS
jgi:hypothetical protein